MFLRSLWRRLRLGRRSALPRREAGPAAALVEAAHADVDAVLRQMSSSRQGLSELEAAGRMERFGPNVVAQERRVSGLRLMARAWLNPLVLLLLVLASISVASGDWASALIMLAMVLIGVTVRFVQEMRATRAEAALRAMIAVTATVIREGREHEIPLHGIVPGDVVTLAAGDMIPADVRLISCKDLFVNQASLTGESLPAEKVDRLAPGAVTGGGSPLELADLCFLGTSVASGSATAVVIATGGATMLGALASAITGPEPQTSFDRGVSRFTWLMIRFIAVMVPVVLVINGLSKGNWTEAFFFALAVAVGLTPEMLPAIVTFCLATGALAMSRRKVIVKRLDAIQNLGAMDVLCTDKTGTLTMGRVILQQHCDVVGRADESVLRMAYLNSHFQTGLRNIMDAAIIRLAERECGGALEGVRKLDEIPFDFSRKLMSVVVQQPGGGARLICKGAPEAIFERCTRFELDGEGVAMNPVVIEDLKEEHEKLSGGGFRVLALAYRDLEVRPAYTKADEAGLVLKGYLAFLDPPKDSAAAAIAALRSRGVDVKLLTGDNERVSRKICDEVGIATPRLLLGGDVERMSDAELVEAAATTTLFARLSPHHKQRIIAALQAGGHVVGFLGDGINDAPALHTADVGLSVDSAVDVARDAAEVILLEKSLLVLRDGVIEGRKVFANILKYVRMGASSNFGNMFSVLGASIFLPYLPMLPVQILTNNLLYDISQVPIPADDVDPEQVARPRPWSMEQITRFIFFIGPCSSVFDYTTFLVMLYLFGCWAPERAPLFHTAWFVESLVTQTLIIHVIRTNRVPFVQSRASWPLMLTTGVVIAVAVILPFSPVAGAMGFVPLPAGFWGLLAVTVIGYVAMTQAVKSWLIRRGWL